MPTLDRNPRQRGPQSKSACVLSSMTVYEMSTWLSRFSIRVRFRASHRLAFLLSSSLIFGKPAPADRALDSLLGRISYLELFLWAWRYVRATSRGRIGTWTYETLPRISTPPLPRINLQASMHPGRSLSWLRSVGEKYQQERNRQQQWLDYRQAKPRPDRSEEVKSCMAGWPFPHVPFPSRPDGLTRSSGLNLGIVYIEMTLARLVTACISGGHIKIQTQTRSVDIGGEKQPHKSLESQVAQLKGNSDATTWGFAVFAYCIREKYFLRGCQLRDGEEIFPFARRTAAEAYGASAAVTIQIPALGFLRLVALTLAGFRGLISGLHAGQANLTVSVQCSCTHQGLQLRAFRTYCHPELQDTECTMGGKARAEWSLPDKQPAKGMKPSSALSLEIGFQVRLPARPQSQVKTPRQKRAAGLCRQVHVKANAFAECRQLACSLPKWQAQARLRACS
ncbi:hypothetical protein B0T17DRAFT_510255 [Bombardia bombarda]|uniref:Uncharacterized protein n=1 Tax=Bombardia bombarda TaxID=252184 RepID=A0AA39WHV9_9PEZI|nr:hypothetical protein B0T17DRAFT_510255 [Bombardia bombarda]